MVEESHHIHPRFMDNPKGDGQQFYIEKTKHNILHGLIMKWLWAEIPNNKKEKVIEKIIKKSKKFIGVDYE